MTATELVFSFDGDDRELFTGVCVGRWSGSIVPNVDRATAARIADNYNRFRTDEGLLTLGVDGDDVTLTTMDFGRTDTDRIRPVSGRYTLDIGFGWQEHGRLFSGILAATGDQIIYPDGLTPRSGRVLGTTCRMDADWVLSYRVLTTGGQIVELTVDTMLEAIIAPTRFCDLRASDRRPSPFTLLSAHEYTPGDTVGFALGDDDTIIAGTYLAPGTQPSQHVVLHGGVACTTSTILPLV